MYAIGMARDRIATFTKAPSKADLQTLLEDYLRNLGATIRWDRDRFFCTLPGKPCDGLARLSSLGSRPGLPEERWIEVWKDHTSVDVMTRCADDITNAIADGLFEIIARFWRATERHDS